MIEVRAYDKINKRMIGWDEILNSPGWQGAYYPFILKNEAHSEIMMSTGEKDHSDREVYEGDIIENPFGVKMEICFGKHRAYCPADQCFMDNVGFYIVAEGFPEMPLGSLNDYAEVVGNIYENPEMRIDRKKIVHRIH